MSVSKGSALGEHHEINVLKEFEESQALHELEAFLYRFNIFEAIGVTSQEIRHSHFLAFLLDPSKPHGLRDAFVKRFLQHALTLADDRHGVGFDELDTWSLEGVTVHREWAYTEGRVDILIMEESRQFVVVIENKIFSGEGHSQLTKYHEVVQKQFPACSVLGLFLTPGGTPPRDSRYVAIDYGSVCRIIDELVITLGESLDPSVHAILTHYTRMLRRNVVTDSELVDKCRRIYQEHKHAIDLINTHAVDRQEQMHDFLVELVNSPEFVRDRAPKEYVRFTLPEWDIQSLNLGTQSWSLRKRMFLLEWRNYPNELHLTLLIGPGSPQVKSKLLAAARGVGDPLSPGNEGAAYVHLFNEQVLWPSHYLNLSIDEMKKLVESAWSTFNSDQLPLLRDKLTPRIKEIAHELERSFGPARVIES